MPNVVAAIAKIVTVVKTFFAAHEILAAIAYLAVSTAISKALTPKFSDNADLKRDITIRTAIESRKIIYGEALVGGVLAYSNIGGDENGVLTTVVINAGHQVSDMTDVYLDATLITDAQIGSGAGADSGSRAVTSGAYFSSASGLGYVAVDRRTGSPTQSSNALLISQFGGDFDSNDRGRNIAYTQYQLSLYEISEKMFEGGSPRDYKTLIKGKLLYDPSADSSPGADIIANGFSSGTYKSYSTNPILAAVDYMLDDRLGMAISPSKINWDEIVDEAAFCGLTVYGSANTLKTRFTANGVLSTFDTHKANIERILSSCNGSVAYKSGKWFVKCGRYGSGANLVTNGTFANLTGWTQYGTGTATASGQLTLTASAGLSKGVHRSLGTVTNGAKYYVQVYCGTIDANITGRISVWTGAGESGTELASATLAATADNSYMEVEFIANGTAAYIHLEATDSAAAGGSVIMDNAEAYIVAMATITADWLRDTLAIQTSLPKGDRFNGAKGFYFSAAEEYKQIQSLEVTNAANLSRDNSEVLFREMSLPFTDTEDEAQRLLFKKLKANGSNVRLMMPCNYLALNLAIYDRVMVTISELGYTNKVFVVESWTLVDGNGGVDIILSEDEIDYYSDLNVDEYATRTTTGALVPATPDVPAPTSVTLSARSGLPDMVISWVDPEPASYYDYAQVWRHTANVFGSATKLVDTRANTYTDTTAVGGTTYYYWVRSRKGTEVSSEVATSPTNLQASEIDAIAKFGTSVLDENDTLVYDLTAINQKILTKGFIGLNHNAYMDMARDDGTPAGFYIGRKTGVASRTSLIGFEGTAAEVMKINSGSARPLILTTAHRLSKGAIQRLFIRYKTTGALNVSLDLRVFLSDSDNLGDGIVSFCTSPSGNESEVGTATRENGLASPPTVISGGGGGNYSGTDINYLFQFLDQGQDTSTPYNAKWICYGIQAHATNPTQDIYIDTLLAYEVSGTIFSGSGAP